MTEAVAAVNMDVPATPAAEESVEITVGDKTFKVSKDAAAAIKASQDAAAEAVSKVSTKLQTVESELQTLKVKPAAPATPDPKANPDRIFSDPKGFIEDLKAEIREEIAGAYTVDQARKEFWSEFYAANSELKEHDFYVKAVFQREMATMGKMTVPEAIKHLGTAAKTDLLKLSGKSGWAGGPKRPVTEGGNETQRGQSNAESGESQPETTETPKSLTGLLKQRREARRTAQQPRATA